MRSQRSKLARVSAPAAPRSAKSRGPATPAEPVSCAAASSAPPESQRAGEKEEKADSPTTEWHTRFGWVPAVQVEPITVRDGVVSLDGYGIRIAVRNGQLELADGLGTTRRAGRFARATCGIKRLVVRGTAFVITGEAIRWLSDIGASFLNLGFDGEILAEWSPPGYDDARLRRAQAFAPWTEGGLELTRYLLKEKLLGQARNLESYFPEAREQVAEHRTWLDRLETASDIHTIRAAEGQAASTYWSVWETMPVLWALRDAKRIPAHWAWFGARISPVSGRTAQAATPGNALLNYLYAILEAETVVACRTIGLDAGMALMHTDKANRQSLALDIMEPVRPLVDAWLARTLHNRAWTWTDFGEVRDGVCRVLPPITHALSETAPEWYKAVSPYVEHVARSLHEASADLALPSAYVHIQRRASTRLNIKPIGAMLTHANRRRTRKQDRAEAAALPSACRVCGVVLDTSGQRYCAEHHPAARREAERRAVDVELGISDAPVEAETPAERKARLSSDQHERIKRFETMYAGAQFDETAYRTRIQPRLAEIPEGDAARALGVSVRLFRDFRAGRRLPHPRHWEILAELVGIEGFALESARIGTAARVCIVCGASTAADASGRRGYRYCSRSCEALAYRARRKAKNDGHDSAQ